jgi:predicted nucleic acid-binding protein
MILLDTNVVSELWRPIPDPTVMSWVNAQPTATQYLCTPVVAELRFGIERLTEGSRKQRLKEAAERLFAGYRGRILNFDVAAAEQFARISVRRERMGRRLEPMDAMIAAVALAHRMILVTRDTNDFLDTGLDLIDPFAESSN